MNQKLGIWQQNQILLVDTKAVKNYRNGYCFKNLTKSLASYTTHFSVFYSQEFIIMLLGRI